MIVRPLEARDVDAVVSRVRRQLEDDARHTPLVNATFSEEFFSRALSDALEKTWVAVEHGDVVGHLYGALLDSTEHGHGAWVGPDGVSFDDADVLAALYTYAASTWLERGASEHYAWVLDDAARTTPWYDLGFARMHARGVLALSEARDHTLPGGYVLRRGGPDDLALALELDAVLDDAQRQGPSFSVVNHASRPDELLEALEDDEVHHYVVELDGEGVAQCLTFPLDVRRGSFEHTLHVSAVSVRPAHEHRGVARALIDRALNDARAAGFLYAETNWRVTNRRAATFWVRYGFSPTYVRLHRTIGSG